MFIYFRDYCIISKRFKFNLYRIIAISRNVENAETGNVKTNKFLLLYINFYSVFAELSYLPILFFNFFLCYYFAAQIF
jgi:hypothetical protein